MPDRGDLEVEFEEVCGENEGVPSFADGAGSKEGCRGEECDDSIDEAVRESAPDPGVHPGSWCGCDGTGEGTACSADCGECIRNARHVNVGVKGFHLW